MGFEGIPIVQLCMVKEGISDGLETDMVGASQREG
jgi:hypothetical protein